MLFLFLILLFYGNAWFNTIHSMEEYSFNSLPHDVVGSIGLQLVKMTGTASIKNQKDIPVIAKYLKAFSFTNKLSYHALNKPEIINALIKELAQRFAISPIEAARHLYCPGSRLFLQAHVKDSVDYDLFKITKQILDAIDELNKKATAQNICSFIGYNKNPKPSDGEQSKKGLFMKAGLVPSQLVTPWGVLELSRGTQGSFLAENWFTQQLLRRLNTLFIKHKSSQYDIDRKHITWYVVENQISSEELMLLKEKRNDEEWAQFHNKVLKPIAENKIENLYNTQCHVVCSYAGYPTTYALLAFDNQELPVPEQMKSRHEFQDDIIVETLWQIMEDLYHQEQLQNGVESLSIDDSGNKKRKSDKSDKKMCASCNTNRAIFNCTLCETVYCSKKCQIQDSINHIKEFHHNLSDNDSINMQIQLVNHIDEIPAMCSYLAINLNAEPLPDGAKSLFKVTKALQINSRDSSLFVILTESTDNILGNQKWPVFTSKLKETDGDTLKDCIRLEIVENRTISDIDSLKAAYEQVIKQIKQGWRQSSLEKHQTIKYTRSQETWYLFIKPKYFVEEDILIHKLAVKFGIRKYIVCDTEGYNINSLANKTLYLWIKKKKLMVVNDMLALFNQEQLNAISASGIH